MALTLAQAQTLTQERLERGIIEEVRYNSPFLDKLPFETCKSYAKKLMRETSAMGSAGFLAPDEEIASTQATFTTATYSLYSAYSQAEVPNFYRKQMSEFEEQMKAQVKAKTKVFTWTIEDQLFYGNADSSNGFDGLHQLSIDCSKTTHMGTSATALSILKLDEVIDGFKGGDPDAMFMSKAMYRRFAAYMRTVSQVNDQSRDEWGRYFAKYRNITIYPCDRMTDTESVDGSGVYTAATGGATSSIALVRFGQGDGLVGLQNGGIETEYWERLEKKDSSMVRMKWYLGLALYSTDAIAILNALNASASVVSGL